MRVIKTWQDIEILEDAEVLNGDYLKEIKEYFRQLHQALGPDEELEAFRLDWPEGFIVILEEGDNPRGLSTVGLSGLERGIIDSRPEFVERIQLKNINLIKVSVLLDNECMMTYFQEEGIHDGEVEEWLKERADEVPRANEDTEEVPF